MKSKKWTKADLKRVRDAISGGALCNSDPGMYGYRQRIELVKNHALELAIWDLRNLVAPADERVKKTEEFVAWCRSEKGQSIYPGPEMGDANEGYAKDDRKGAARLRNLINRLETEGLPEEIKNEA